jgi:hypothetical protein
MKILLRLEKVIFFVHYVFSIPFKHHFEIETDGCKKEKTRP